MNGLSVLVIKKVGRNRLQSRYAIGSQILGQILAKLLKKNELVEFASFEKSLCLKVVLFPCAILTSVLMVTRSTSMTFFTNTGTSSYLYVPVCELRPRAKHHRRRRASVGSKTKKDLSPAAPEIIRFFSSPTYCFQLSIS